MNSSNGFLDKQALIINDKNRGNYKYIINIKDPHVTAAGVQRPVRRCSALNTILVDEVYWNNGVGSRSGKTARDATHSYTDGEHDHVVITTYSEWTKFDARNEWRDVTKTCDYCHRSKTHKEVASVYRLQYNLNGGVGDETADYNEAFYP